MRIAGNYHAEKYHAKKSPLQKQQAGNNK